MKLEEYKSGEYVKMNDYKAFIPSKINYNWGWDDTKLDKLLAEANRQIGELNAYSLLIPNVDLYIKMHVKIEANKSSRIEGTRTTVEEDLLDVTDINPEKRDDWEEVQNYVKATNYGVERIKNGQYMTEGVSWDSYSRTTNCYRRRIDRHQHDCPTEEGSVCCTVSRTSLPLQDITVLKACCFCAMNIPLYRRGVILTRGFTYTSLKNPSESYSPLVLNVGDALS